MSTVFEEGLDALFWSCVRRARGPRRDAAPFLKWAGGKRRLLPVLRPLLPPGVQHMRYVEPFVGGGAMFFALAPERAVLCDANFDLVNAYTAVRDEVSAVIEHLEPLARAHCGDHYSAVRERHNARKTESSAERAAMFIYLNKTCFNGLHRTNKSGDFNVPMGRYENPTILDERALRAASAQLARAELRCQPFERLLDEARAGDFVYLDPPYAPASSTANFTSYTQESFGDAQQIALRDVCLELSARGCLLMLSNSDVPFIRELYRTFKIDGVSAPRSISSGTRAPAREVVVRNY